MRFAFIYLFFNHLKNLDLTEITWKFKLEYVTPSQIEASI